MLKLDAEREGRVILLTSCAPVFLYVSISLALVFPGHGGGQLVEESWAFATTLEELEGPH